MAPDRIIEDSRAFLGEDGRYKLVDLPNGTKEVVDISVFGGETLGTIETDLFGNSEFVSNNGSRADLNDRLLDGRFDNIDSVRELNRAIGATKTTAKPGSSSSDWSDYGSSTRSVGWNPETFTDWISYFLTIAILAPICIIGLAWIVFPPAGLILTVVAVSLVGAAIMYCYEFLLSAVNFITSDPWLVFWAVFTVLVAAFNIWVWFPEKKGPKNKKKK